MSAKQNISHCSESLSRGACSFLFYLKLAAVIIGALFIGKLPALGDNQPYRGTFMEQITSTEDTNLYQVGEIFTGYYQYLAPAPDGAFATSGYMGSGNWTNYTLDGSIYLPFSSETSWTTNGTTTQLNYGSGGEQIGLTQTPNGGWLTVQSGHATNFSWSYDNGGFYFQIGVGANGAGSFQTLSFYDTPGSLITDGTVQFGDPAPAPEPDVTALWLVGVAGVTVGKLIAGKRSNTSARCGK